MSDHSQAPLAANTAAATKRHPLSDVLPRITGMHMEGVLIATAILLVACAYFVLLRLNVYGLDEVQYYADFTFKLKEEGRWINSLLHHTLRLVPLPVGAFAYVVLLWLLTYTFAAEFTNHQLSRVAVASLLCIGTPFVDQSLWPVSLLPTLVVMLALAWLVRTGASHRIVYTVGGVLLFGCMQNYYFLLPLLYANHIVRPAGLDKKFVVTLVDHLVWWVLGCAIGVGVALLAIYLMTGQVGVHPAAWRKPMPIHGVDDLWRNIAYVWSQLFAHLRWFFFKLTHWDDIMVGAIVILAFLRLQRWRVEIARFVFLAIIAVSFFAFSIPLSPVIQDRSLVALSVTLALLLLVPYAPSRVCKWLSIALCLWASWNLAGSAYADLSNYKQNTDFVLQKIDGSLPLNPSSYRAVAVIGTASPAFPDSQILNRAPMMRAIMLSTGAHEFLDCQQDPGNQDCAAALAKFKGEKREHADGIEYFGTTSDVAVLSIGNQ